MSRPHSQYTGCLTSPSVDLMLASCTTSKCAAWDTMGSDDREIMWSHTPDRVLHWGKQFTDGVAAILKSALCIVFYNCTTLRNSPHVGFCFPFRTRNSPAEQSEHCYLRECVKIRELLLAHLLQVDVKQKSSSLAPITHNTPTQTCTNTKQMNHHCGGMYFSLSLSLSIYVSAGRPLSAINSLSSVLFSLPPFLLTFLSSQNINITVQRPSY